MGKHDKILANLFQEPTKATIRWQDAVALFKHCGAEVCEAEGSRVKVLLNGCVAVFHKPHPQPEIKKSSVKSIRKFLIHAGIQP